MHEKDAKLESERHKVMTIYISFSSVRLVINGKAKNFCKWLRCLFVVGHGSNIVKNETCFLTP